MNPFVLLSLVLVQLSPTSCQTLQDLTDRNSDLAARLYRAVAGRSDGNVCLSPFILSSGLMALLSATNGSTQDQLLQGLTLSGLDPQGLPDLFQSLSTMVLQGDLSLSLQQGMALLPAQTLQLSPSYVDLVQTKYGGKVQTLTYTMPMQAVDSINRWTQEQTGDQVQELVSNLDPQTQLLLATVAAYQAGFSPAFNSSLTQDERFYVDKYHVVMAPMMFRAGKYFLVYDRLLKAGVLRLPMSHGAAMLVVLPDEDTDITSVEEEVTGEKIQSWIKQLKKTKLEVQVPRFLLEGSYSLKDVLKTMDITRVFEDDADMANIGGDKRPPLTQVFHKSLVSIDERGDDITAGSRVNTFSTLPPRLTVNRPFIFIIYRQDTGSLLFIGRVVDPTRK